MTIRLDSKCPFAWIVFLPLGLYSGMLFAAPPLPSAAEPAQAGQATALKPNIEEPTSRETSPYQGLLKRKQLPKEVTHIQFQLDTLNITDLTVFCYEDLIAPYRDCLGKVITLGKLQEIANDMTRRYQNEGYVLTQVIIPEQKIINGVATLQVISGYIDIVEICGDIQPAHTERLKCFGSKIHASVPLQIKKLERYALLANDIAGMQVKAVLKPSKTKSGATDLKLIACQNRGRASLEANNFGSVFLGPRQFLMNADAYSLFRPGDATMLQVVTTNNKKMNYLQLRHEELIGNEGLKNGIFGRHLRSNPGSFLASLNIQGLYTVLGTDLSFPLIRSRNQNLFLLGGISVLEDKVTVANSLLYRDRIQPLSLSVIYNRIDALQALNYFDLNLSHGLKIWNPPDNTLISRRGGRADFTKLNYLLSRNQPITQQLSFFAKILGQFAFNPLLASSQFSFGGSDLGRGYEPSELLGDRGLAGSLELRYDKEISCQSWIFSTTQLYTFYDIGKVWNIRSESGSGSNSASSMGAGLRLPFTDYGRIHFFLAKPLNHVVSATGKKTIRAYMSFTMHAP